MRTSSYTIFIPYEDGKTILVHGYTGAIDIVESNVVSSLKSRNKSCIKINKNTLDLLKEREYLTNKTDEDERLRVRRFFNLCINILGKNWAGKGFTLLHNKNYYLYV